MVRLQHLVLMSFCMILVTMLTGCDCNGKGAEYGCPEEPVAAGAAILTGRFIDSPVEGLQYQTPTQSGTTNASGEFTYQAGETVTFRVGSIIVGSAPGASELNPFSISGMTAPTTQAEMEHLINVVANGGLSRFSAAINRATFLQSLDSDSNPDNGITLPTGLASVVANTHLNFAQSFQSFKYDLDIKVLRTATRAGIYAQLRKARPSNLVVAKLFAGLGLSPRIARDSQFLHKDMLSNATIERRITTFDSHGNPSSLNRDFDGNNSIDYREVTVYDIYGNLTSLERDDDGAGAGGITYRQTATYTNGVRTQFLTDADGDGPIAPVRHVYDQLGNETLYEVDTNGDSPGGVIFRISYTYDAMGNILTQAMDPDGGGSTIIIDTYTYDAPDANGNITGFTVNYGAPGSVASRFTATYDANSNQLSYKKESSGVTERFETFTYDTNDNLRTYNLDSNGDGSFDSTETYSYDPNGNQLTYDEDSDADGFIDYNEVYAFDPNGNPLSYAQYLNGSLDYRNTYTYDSHGNQDSYNVDSDGDSLIDYRETYTYDTNGALLTANINYDADGSIDETITYTNVLTPVGWSLIN